MVLNEVVVFACAGHVAAASEPSEFAETRCVEVGQCVELAVDAGGAEEMMDAYVIRRVGIGLEDYVVGALS